MRSLNKALALVLAIVMCLSVLPAVAPAAKADDAVTTLTLDMITYKINDDGTLTITGYDPGDVLIPGIEIPASFEIDGQTYVVSEIGADAFASKGISTLVFGEGSQIVQIDERAFSANLFHKTNFPSTLKVVKTQAFLSVEWWGTLDLGDTQIEVLEPWAFGKVTAAKKYNSSGKLVIDYASSGVPADPAAIVLPENLRIIMEGNFYNNELGNGYSKDYSTIEFPSSLEYIGYQSLKKNSGSNNPRTVLDFSLFAPGTIGYNNPGYESDTGDDESYEDYIGIEDSTSRWGFSCDNAKVIWADPGQKNERDTDSPFIFNYKTGVIVGLKDECATKSFEPYWVLTEEVAPLNSKTTDYTYILPDNSRMVSYKGNLTIPKEIEDPTTHEMVQVTGIYPGAFNRFPAYCQLKSVTFENGVAIDDVKPYTFDCPNLETVTNIPETVTAIRTRAFAVCSNLTEIELPGVTVVERKAFQNCTKLSKVTFGSSAIESIHPLAFSPIASDNLKEIHLEGMEKDTVPNYCSAEGAENTYVSGAETPYATLYWKDGVVDEPQFAVGTDSHGLKWNYDLRAGKLLSYAGTDYSEINGKNLEIPSTLTSDVDGSTVKIRTLGNNARIFSLIDGELPNIGTLTIEPGITVISDKVFAYEEDENTNNERVSILIDKIDLSGSTVERIGQDAFYCTESSVLKLPDTLRSTKINCFAGAGHTFTEVEIPGNVNYMHGSSFTGVTSLTKITVRMNRYGLEDDPGFVQGQWTSDSTVYKLAPANVYAGAPYGAKLQDNAAVQVIFMDGPKAAPKYVLTPNAETNTVDITINAYSTYDFYVVSKVVYNDTEIQDVVPENMGMRNATTTRPVTVDGNGTYTFTYTVKRVRSDDPAFQFTNDDSVKVDLFHGVTYAKDEAHPSSGGADIKDDKLYVPGATVTAPKQGDLSYSGGYVFRGWTYTVKETELVVNEDGKTETVTTERSILVSPSTDTQESTFIMPDEDVTLTEYWEDISDHNIDVYFHAGEGANFGSATMTEIQKAGKYGDNLKELIGGNFSPSKPGYKFTGEWTDAEGTVVTAVPNTFAEDSTRYDVYAQYIEKDITVVFDANEGRFEVENYAGMESGVYKGTFDVPVVTRTGYDFTGWNTKKDGTGDALTVNEGKASFPASNTKYFAQWKAVFHNVTFVDSDGGELWTTEHGVETGGKFGACADWDGFMMPSANKEGYKFIGWKAANKVNGEYVWLTNEEGVELDLFTTEDQIHEFVVETEDVYFVAQYEAIQYGDIVFDFNGGLDENNNSAATARGEVGTVIPAAQVPSSQNIKKDGYKFVGWTVDKVGGEGTTGFDLEFKEGSYTVYANWESTTDKPDNPTPPSPSAPVPDSIQVNPFTYDHVGYIKGYGDDTFKPEAGLKRSEAAQILFNLLADKSAGDKKVSFSDVTEGSWYHEAVTVLASRGIIKGYPDGEFKPDKYISRAEFIALCARYYEKPAELEAMSVKVSKDHWAYDYIDTADALGWLVDFDADNFKPNAKMTRAEVVSVANKMLERTPDKDYIDANIASLKTFKDVDTSYWCYYDIMEAANAHGHKTENGKEVWGPYEN